MAGYGDFSYYYDLLTENVDYEKRCDYICDLLAENGVGKGILLDLACGTGSLSFLFEKKGYDVVAVDSSEDMLCVAQEKKAENGSDVIFLCQKMQELDLFGTIDAAICSLDSLNHITDEEDFKEALRKVALFMNDGGVFVFDVNTPYKHEKILADNTFVYDFDRVYCVWQNTFFKESCLTQVNLDIFEADEDEEDVYIRTSEQFSERGYPLEKIKQWLSDFRFEVLGVFEEMTRNDVKEDSQRAVFVCKKHGTQFI